MVFWKLIDLKKKMVANVILNVSANCYENSEYKEYVEQYVII